MISLCIADIFPELHHPPCSSLPIIIRHPVGLLKVRPNICNNGTYKKLNYRRDCARRRSLYAVQRHSRLLMLAPIESRYMRLPSAE